MDIPEMQRNRIFRFSDIVIRDFGGSSEESGRSPEGAIEYILDEYPFGYDFAKSGYNYEENEQRDY